MLTNNFSNTTILDQKMNSSSSSSQILAPNHTTEEAKNDKKRESLLFPSKTQRFLDSVVTVRTSYVSFKEGRGLKRSFSQEDISLYESQIKKKNIDDSRADEKEKSDMNKEIQNHAKSRKDLSKRYHDADENVESLNEPNNDYSCLDEMRNGVMMLRSQKYSNRDYTEANKNMEDTLENIIQCLDIHNNIPEGFNSGLRSRLNLTEDRNNISMQLRRILENDQEKMTSSSLSKSEVKSEKSNHSVAAIPSQSVKVMKKSNCLNKILMLLSVSLNFIFLYLMIHPKLRKIESHANLEEYLVPEYIEEVVVPMNVTELVKTEPELYVVPPVSTCNISHSEDITANKEELESYKRTLEEKVRGLEIQLSSMKQRKMRDNEIIADLGMKNDRLLEEFSQVEQNVQHTFEIIGKLKKHISSPEVGDALSAHFKGLMSLIKRAN